MTRTIPRLPLDGNIDLTYRCNQACRHCWLWLPHNAPEKQQELSTDEIKKIVNDARMLGCQTWAISGGEPMLRADFSDIFDYITRKAVSYSLNTNGTLITPDIARLLTRKGRKMVALYGATAEVYEKVTRVPGSFSAALRGMAYLKEAGANFIVQIVPMRENFYQYAEMLELAKTLSPHTRVGAAWLWLSANHSDIRNREIKRQRLNPADAILLDPPDPSNELPIIQARETISPTTLPGCVNPGDNRLFKNCIDNRRDFHIDPYGQLSFCYYVKDPALRYNLRQGSFKQAWEEFLPSLTNMIQGNDEYQENCGACEYRSDCRWCGVYAYLEHGRYTARVEYLCRTARENRFFKEKWKINQLRYYQIAGLTIQITTDYSITEDTFDPKFERFRVDKPGDDVVSIRHVSIVPPLTEMRLGEKIYNKVPWVIYKQPHSWLYLRHSPEDEQTDPDLLALFNTDHTQGTIYRPGSFFQQYRLHSLSTLPTDQMVLARVLAERQGCFLHSAGMIIDGNGFVFVGHSGAGKSTMIKMLREHGEILCDDRIILRRWPDLFRIHGTWSHGELPDISASEAPLKAIFYLEKAPLNQAILVDEKTERFRLILPYIVRPLISADWWEKILLLANRIALEVPAYRLLFDKSGDVVDVIKGI